MIKLLKSIILLCISILLVNCNSGNRNTINYANDLKGCIEPQHIEVLNRLSQNFETYITNTYKTDVVPAYKQYISEAAVRQLDPDFFHNPVFKKDIALLKSSGFFDMARAKLAEVEKDDDEFNMFDEIPITESSDATEEEERAEQYRREIEKEMTALDPNGAYVKCLSAKNEHPLITSYLDRLNTGMVIIPSFIASAMQNNLTDSDYHNSFIRLFIAINIHYEMLIMLNDVDE